jgi:hypothetical protein
MATVLERITPKAQKRPEAGTVHWLNECVERGRREIFSQVITLTPGLAGELLRRNPDNRHIRRTKLAQMMADIRAGRWALNGEAIIISKCGLVNGGQHRCQAVIETNTPIQLLLTFGVERDTRTTLDQGAGRTASDYLSMEGVPNATTQASIARQLVAYNRSNGTSLSGSGDVTNAEVLDYVYSDPKIGEAAHFAATHAKAARHHAPPAVIGLCYYLFADINELEAKEYLTQVCTGENIGRRHPAYTVRERLLSLESNSRDARTHIVIRGWNAFRQGRPLSIAKIMGGASNLPALI